MKAPRQTLLHLAAIAAALTVVSVGPAVLAGKAHAQTSRTIKIVVPLPAGGTADILARILGEQVSHDRGVTVVVENRPGAGAIIGTEAVSRAAPDGNTLLLTAPAFVISPHLRKLNYDPLTGFAPVCHLTSTPTVILVNGASPYRTLADLLDAARARPGTLTMATVPGGVPHIAFEMLRRAANVDMTLVPFAGGAPAVNALLGNHVTAVFLPYAGLAEQVKAGRLRALASAAPTRSEQLSEMPTVAESGYKGYEADFWNGLVVPANTPKETVSELAEWFTAAMRVPEVKAKLVAQSLYPVGICGADFGALLRKQYEAFGRVIHEANIKAE